MAVVLRLKRMGRRNRPTYRISATDNRNPRDGRTLETLGHYDPASPVEALRLKLDPERVRHWLSMGAKPSETVASLLRKEGISSTKPPKPRDRSGRKKVTAAKTRRIERKKTTSEAKVARRTARVTAVRDAAKAAKAAKAAEAGAEEAGS